MSKPENPNTIIIKNDFYPNGLTEIDVWNYYQKFKGHLLNQTRNRYLASVIMVDVNKPVIKRKGTATKFITLNNSNYDTVITGRTVAFYATMKMYEEFGIVDIDCDQWNRAKEATIDVFNSIKKLNEVKSISIRYTGKSSFHVVPYFKSKLKIDQIRQLIRNHLISDKTLKYYTVEYKRRQGIPNLDIAINKYNGAFIIPYSLSILGLKCMSVPSDRIYNFQKIQAKIK